MSDNEQNVVKDSNKNLKILIVILLLIIVGLSMFMLGQHLSNKNNTVDDTKPFEESSIESETSKKEESSKYKGKVFYVNSKKNEYIKFTSDKDYEYKHRSFESNNILSDNGTYTINGNSIIFDNGDKRVNVYSNYIEFVSKDFEISDDNDYMYYLYFEEDKLIETNELISSALENYMKKLRNEDSTLPEVTRVDNIELNYCYRSNKESNENVMNCSLGYTIYVKDYDKNKCDKYISYGGAGAECEESYVRGSSFYSLEKTNETLDIKSQFSAP